MSENEESQPVEITEVVIEEDEESENSRNDVQSLDSEKRLPETVDMGEYSEDQEVTGC